MPRIIPSDYNQDSFNQSNQELQQPVYTPIGSSPFSVERESQNLKTLVM